ncbi:MAG: hypothetical protein EA376_12435 [Phycisphaeraceae bacterium]|nr:MAG: hypothetical protein EA376_12435 [Phycisphaeraceae bacterium]
MKRTAGAPSATRMIEMGAVVMVAILLLIIGGPRLIQARQQTVADLLEQRLGDVRIAIAHMYSERSAEGRPGYPSVGELAGPGAPAIEIPVNPLTGVATVQPATRLEAWRREVTGAGGWRYYVDNDANPPEAVFYADVDAPTHFTDPQGLPIRANEL